MDLALTYSPDPQSTELFRTFSDADHAGEVDNRKSTGGFVVMMGTGVKFCCKGGIDQPKIRQGARSQVKRLYYEVTVGF